MADRRREHRVLFQVEGRRPMPAPYPQVSYRTGAELRAAIARAARWYWPAYRTADVTFDAGFDWRHCRGHVYITLPTGTAADVAFVPVFDPDLPAEVQARRPEGAR